MSCDDKNCADCNQVGGDGYTMSMTENIGGQPVVEGYNDCCGDAAQVGGGPNPFNFIINPVTGARMSLFSSGGKAILQNLIRQYKYGGSDTTTSVTDAPVTPVAAAPAAGDDALVPVAGVDTSDGESPAPVAGDTGAGDTSEGESPAPDAANGAANGAGEGGVDTSEGGDESALVGDVDAEDGVVGPSGGAPAEMPDAFGKDYFDTEADALKAEW